MIIRTLGKMEIIVCAVCGKQFRPGEDATFRGGEWFCDWCMSIVANGKAQSAKEEA